MPHLDNLLDSMREKKVKIIHNPSFMYKLLISTQNNSLKTKTQETITVFKNEKGTTNFHILE